MKVLVLLFGLILNFSSLVHAQLLKEKVGPISYLSLAGKKDLIIKSTGKPMTVLHVQHGPMAESQTAAPQKDFVHMICAPVQSSLNIALQPNFKVAATASILSHRMSKVDWNFILTSDI